MQVAQAERREGRQGGDAAMLQVLCAWSLQVKLPRRAVLLLLLGCSRLFWAP